MGKRKRKKTPEERAAQDAYSKDLDRRMIEKIESYWKLTGEYRTDLDRRLGDMIERYRRLNAKKRASGGEG